jgi:Xaa-Pro aminopeptidase
MSQAEFAKRRRAVMDRIGPQAVAIVPAAPHRLRNHDVHYPYRQDSDFQYLTGFPEPEAVAVLAPGRAEGEFLLFCRERDPERETWDGRRAGQAGAQADYGADQALPISQLDEWMPKLLGGREQVHHTLGQQGWLDQKLIGWLKALRGQSRRGVQAPSEVVSLEPVLHEMRLFKNDAEIALMQRAASVSAAAHRRAMRACKAGMREYQLAAEIHHEYERNGLTWAYGSIVGGGANACILHYVENNDTLKDGDLVLIDAGGEWQGYCADITRSFPVNGSYSPAQKALYEVVLAAQQAAIDVCQVGQHWNRPHEAAVQVLTEGLLQLGLLRGDAGELIEKEAYRRFYMHSTGHWLGMDVHDVGAYKLNNEWRPFEPGMVLTVEPGLYVTPAEDVAEPFWNIGIRIEDDILITANGPRVLTNEAPKQIADIEALMRSGSLPLDGGGSGRG